MASQFRAIEYCPGCGCQLGNCIGTSSLTGSHDVTDLCEGCWLAEEDVIDEEGTNSPEFSEKIKMLLDLYRYNMANQPW